jgi:hypothetical protein
MKVIGYLIVAMSFYAFYLDKIALGVPLLMLGGILSGGLSVSISSFAHVALVALVAYAFNNDYSWEIILGVIFTIIVLLSSKSGGGYWEIPYCIFDDFLNFDKGFAGNLSDSDSGSDGMGFSDGGGGDAGF